MKIAIEKYELESALNRVRDTVAGSDVVQVLTCFCFRNGTVSTFNGVAGTVTELNLQGMTFAVPAEKFYKLVVALPKSLTLELDETTGVLTVESGAGTFKVNTVPSKGFPYIVPQERVQWTYAPNFVTALSRVSFSMSDNATQPALNGIGVYGDYVYSTDTLRVSRYKLSMPVPDGMTIPKPAVSSLIRLGQPEQFLRTRSQIVAWYPSTKTTYVSNLCASDFPFEAAERALNFTAGNVAAEFPIDMSSALERVRLFSPEENSDVILESTGNGIVLYTASQIGKGKEFVPWTFPGTFKIAANPVRLKQALDASQKVDLTNVVQGDKRMLIFSHADGFQHLLALMALRD